MRRLIVALLLLAAIIGGAWYWEQQNFLAPGPTDMQTVVLIAPGRGVPAIAQELAKAGVVRNANLFRFGVRLTGQQSALKAGEYAIPAHASMASITGILVAGKSIEHKLTVAEGLTSKMAYDLVVADPVLVGDAGPVPAEGTLLPETYLFTRGTTRAELLHRMQAAQAKLLDRLWPDRAKDLPYTTKEQALIVASIVEKETALPDERRHIAAVFVNRLKQGMKLQSDPTIIYGLTKGYPLGRGIRESELQGATPYNTYVIGGLPPTPICNPGKDSIAAVLDPAQSDDLYFVADGTGGHVFSTTIAEHEQNVAKWRKVEQANEPVPPPPPPRHRKLPKRHRRR